MEASLDATFTRVEASLNTLIDSITSYNPVVEDAKRLVEADRDLAKELQKLEQHQANHARILALRQTTESLDSTLKSVLQTLAETRKDLLATAVTTFPKDSRDVPFDELLAYANFISKTTRPPATQDTPPEPPSDDKTEPSQPKATNGTTQSPAPEATQTTQASATAPDPSQDVSQPTQTTQKGLSQEMQFFLDATASTPWEPWPSNDRIRSGNLFAIARMLDSGQDPWKVLSAEEQAEEAERKQVEEERVRRSAERTAAEERARRESVYKAAQGQGREERRAEAYDDGGLDLYDPDEE